VRVLAAGDVSVALLGTGKTVLVLSDQSDQDLCSWLPFTGRFLAAGYGVALWDYGSVAPIDELAGGVAAVRSAGAAKVVLVGASKGAKVSLLAAVRVRPPVAGVVSLSAEDTLQPGIDVVAAVRPLRVPVVLLTSAGDLFGSAQAAAGIARSMSGSDKKVISVPGAAHGTALLPAVLAPVITFLRRVGA
jgi:pimeloyl-ACP methyl ester carboxylesterase